MVSSGQTRHIRNRSRGRYAATINRLINVHFQHYLRWSSVSRSLRSLLCSTRVSYLSWNRDSLCVQGDVEVEVEVRATIPRVADM